jgi:hypothetical protein
LQKRVELALRGVHDRDAKWLSLSRNKENTIRAGSEDRCKDSLVKEETSERGFRTIFPIRV